ncbi:hypothetical protein ZIOFF_043632 [Zingiber officinale]|uniref:Uncharacterized protein n=1 Tax=Zingiber officinale TaxID=94328 RepID=A0A8J5KU33_ZINOF|nr:hypothetical protein ZIOFF_043632 [Zingiber officinale]
MLIYGFGIANASGCVYPATSRAYEDVDEAQDYEIDEEEFKEEQNSVTCLIHMLYNDDLEEMLKSNHRHNYGLDLLLLSVDEGITGYRDDSLENVKRNEIEVVDLLVSYQRGEKIGLFDGASVGKTGFIIELMINNIGKDWMKDGFSIIHTAASVDNLNTIKEILAYCPDALDRRTTTLRNQRCSCGGREEEFKGGEAHCQFFPLGQRAPQ